MWLGVVIPAYRENAIADTVKALQKGWRDIAVIVVADDRLTADAARSVGAMVVWHPRKRGYGKSLIEGLELAWFTFDCDLVVEMDVDHPVDAALGMARKLQRSKFDLAVGVDNSQSWKLARKGANALAKKLLGLEVTHPTCGLVAFKQETLMNLPLHRAKCNGDGVHIELLHLADRLHMGVMDYPFEGHGGERWYGLRRMWSWWWCFMRVIRWKYLWGWRDYTK